jgi:hypothetical protein
MCDNFQPAGGVKSNAGMRVLKYRWCLKRALHVHKCNRVSRAQRLQCLQPHTIRLVQLMAASEHECICCNHTHHSLRAAHRVAEVSASVCYNPIAEGCESVNFSSLTIGFLCLFIVFARKLAWQQLLWRMTPVSPLYEEAPNHLPR